MDRGYGLSLAIIRMLVGFFWLSHGVAKIMDHFVPGGMVGTLGKQLTPNIPFYHEFVQNVVLQHASLFATLVQWGETIAGVLLLFGFFTRVGAGLATFLALNYMTMSGGWLSLEGYWSNPYLALLLSVLFLVLPGEAYLSIDAARMRGRRRIPAGSIPY